MSVENKYLTFEVMKALASRWGLHTRNYKHQMKPDFEAAKRRRFQAHGRGQLQTGAAEFIAPPPPNVAQMSVLDLKVECNTRCLNSSGSPAELMERILSDHKALVRYQRAGYRTSPAEDLWERTLVNTYNSLPSH